jgi:hypothetical protein
MLEEMRRNLDERIDKYVFVGYSEESKSYRLYNPITKNYVINRDVEFKEEEAWDGSIDKAITDGDEFSHGDDASDDQVIQGGKFIPQSPKPATRTPVRKSPRFNLSQLRTPRTHKCGRPSRYGGHQET